MALKRTNGYSGQLVEPQFFINNSGMVGWTDGKAYTETGDAPDRVRVLYLTENNELHRTYEFIETMDRAHWLKVAKWRVSYEAYVEAEETRLKAAYERAVQELHDPRGEWKARFKAAGIECVCCGGYYGPTMLAPGCNGVCYGC